MPESVSNLPGINKISYPLGLVVGGYWFAMYLGWVKFNLIGAVLGAVYWLMLIKWSR